VTITASADIDMK